MAGTTTSRVTRWVQGELRGMMPRWFPALFLGVPAAHALVFAQGPARITRQRGQIVVPLALLDEAEPEPEKAPAQFRGLPVVVHLPRGALLARQITAPAKARGQVAAIAGLDLIRRTPFKADEVNWVLSAPVRDGDRITVTQWVMRRSDAARLTRRLGAQGLVVQAIRVADEATEPALLVDHAQTGPARAMPWRRLNGAAIALALLAALAGWLYPTWRASGGLAALIAERAALQDRALALRSDLDGLRALATEQGAFVATMVRRARLSQNLRDLTVALPDEVWLSELSYSPQSVVLTGETAKSAADLVLALAEVRSFTNPRLSGPVQRSESGAERFEIALDHETRP